MLQSVSSPSEARKTARGADCVLRRPSPGASRRRMYVWGHRASSLSVWQLYPLFVRAWAGSNGRRKTASRQNSSGCHASALDGRLKKPIDTRLPPCVPLPAPRSAGTKARERARQQVLLSTSESASPLWPRQRARRARRRCLRLVGARLRRASPALPMPALTTLEPTLTPLLTPLLRTSGRLRARRARWPCGARWRHRNAATREPSLCELRPMLPTWRGGGPAFSL